MRIVLQRVQEAHVEVGGKTVARIGPGLLLLVGISPADTEEDARFLADKCVQLRIFEDEQGKMNISGLDRKADILAVSQFTLYADCRKGRRPSFVNAAPPDISQPLFEKFVARLQEYPLRVEKGVFGAHMKVHLVNDGPVTIILDSEVLRSGK